MIKPRSSCSRRAKESSNEGKGWEARHLHEMLQDRNESYSCVPTQAQKEQPRASPRQRTQGRRQSGGYEHKALRHATQTGGERKEKESRRRRRRQEGREDRHADMQTRRPGTMTRWSIAEHRDVQLYPPLVMEAAPRNHDKGATAEHRDVQLYLPGHIYTYIYIYAHRYI